MCRESLSSGIRLTWPNQLNYLPTRKVSRGPSPARLLSLYGVPHTTTWSPRCIVDTVYEISQVSSGVYSRPPSIQMSRARPTSIRLRKLLLWYLYELRFLFAKTRPVSRPNAADSNFDSPLTSSMMSPPTLNTDPRLWSCPHSSVQTPPYKTSAAPHCEASKSVHPSCQY